jgi:hypothetical protein
MEIFGTDIDLNGNEFKHFRPENLLSFPVSPDTGQIIMHTGLGSFYGYDGSTWKDLALSGGGSYILPTATDVILGGVKIDGTTITIDGGGTISAVAIPAAIIAQDDGNGDGYVIESRDPTKYSPVGLNSIDLTINGVTEGDTDYGVESPGGFSTGAANKLPSGVSNFGSHQAHGYGNTVQGYYGNMAYGTYNNITDGYNFVTFGYSNSATMTSTVGHGFSAGGFNSSTSYWNNALGFRISASAKGFTGVGLANTVYSGGVTASDRPAFTVGIGDAVSSTGPTYGDVVTRKDGFVVKFNGETVFPETTIAIIDAEATGRTPVTREWIEAQGYISDNLYTASGTLASTTTVTIPEEEALIFTGGVNAAANFDDLGTFNVSDCLNLTLRTTSLDNQIVMPNLGSMSIIAERGLVLTLGSGGTATPPTANQVLISSDGSGTLAWADASGSTGLELITEGANDGWRLIGRNSANYADIGNGAIDFSFNGVAGSVYGASGSFSFASGGSAIASESYSTAFGHVPTSSGYASLASGHFITAGSYAETAVGHFNTTYTPVSTTAYNIADRAFGVGIGANGGARADGLIVLKSGEVTAPSLTTTIIGAEATGKVLTTKEWVSANVVLTTTTQSVSGVKTFTSQVNCPRTLFTSNLALAPAVVNIGRHNDNFYIGGTGGATTNHFTLEAGWGGGDTTLREFVFPSYDGDIAVVKTVPSSSTDVGDVGNIAIDSSYIYVCTATDTWRRVATSTW